MRQAIAPGFMGLIRRPLSAGVLRKNQALRRLIESCSDKIETKQRLKIRQELSGYARLSSWLLSPKT
jgi:hypothetical protein